VVELQSSLVEQGPARNDGVKQRPWWHTQIQREKHGREETGEREREGKRKKGEACRPGRLQEVASVAWAQAGGGHGGLLGASTQVLHEEDKELFAKIPLAFGVFWEF
jgi:hypothetical protein